MSKPKNTISRQKRIDDAEAFIRFNKSDPFCRNRVYTHMRNGIASFTEKGEDAFYSATELNGSFSNIKCP